MTKDWILLRCWRPWRHAPHWQVGMDLGYDQWHVRCLCLGGLTKGDVTLCR